MQQQNIPIGTLVDMYKRGELRLPEIQRHYVWQATRVRDLLDSLYRGYPSGSILMWETDEPVPTRDFAIAQETNAFAGRKLLLDGQQRLTSLTAVLGGELVSVPGQSHLHVITPRSSARNSSIVAASMRLDLMLALRVVLSRSRFITMWRTMARLFAA